MLPMTDRVQEQEAVEEAKQLVRSHFNALSRGDLKTARLHVVPVPSPPLLPGCEDKDLEGLAAAGPFDVQQVVLEEVVTARETPHGHVATIWLSVEVRTPVLGVRSKRIPVWWFPATGRLVIAARLLSWSKLGLERGSG